MESTPPRDLAGLVTLFRDETVKAARNKTSAMELELRFAEVSAENFAVIFQNMRQNAAVTGGPVFTCTVNAAKNCTDDRARASIMRVITLEGGHCTGDEYRLKRPILKVYVPETFSYRAALSEEQEASETRFTSSSGQITTRVKLRASFEVLLAEARWRVDMTIVVTLAHEDAMRVKKVAQRLFGTEVTPESFLAALKVDTPHTTEVEAEFIGDGKALRADDIAQVGLFVAAQANISLMRDADFSSKVLLVATAMGLPRDQQRAVERNPSLKRLLPQVTALTRESYAAIFPPQGMFLTDKADGVRAIGLIHRGEALLLTDTVEHLGKVPPDVKMTIIDGELVTSGAGRHFYIFDVIVCNDVWVGKQGFEDRLTHLAEAARLFSHGMPCSPKRFLLVEKDDPESIRAVCMAALQPAAYEVDGLILTEAKKTYVNTRNFKWKPLESNTIDFLARRAPRDSPLLAGRVYPGFAPFFLFVGISADLFTHLSLPLCPDYEKLFHGHGPDAPYFPVQFSPCDAPQAYVYWHPVAGPDIEGKIVELRRLLAGDEQKRAVMLTAADKRVGAVWQLVRVREDREGERRYFGNDYRVAEAIWHNYADPLTLEGLWSGAGSAGYFRGEKSGIYQAQTALISAMKEHGISCLADQGLVVDLGAGRGGDLGRYFSAGVRELIAVDSDEAALVELARRRYARQVRRQNKSAPKAPPLTRTLVYDLAAGTPAGLVYGLAALDVAPGKVDGLVCNLALHYFVSNDVKMREFAELSWKLLRPGGLVVVTVMVGSKVHALLDAIPEGGTWDLVEAGAKKYSLRRMFSAGPLAAASQKIAVMHPFSAGEYYEEWLINTEAMIGEFLARGFAVVEKHDSALDFVVNLGTTSPELRRQLTENDQTYADLYGLYILRKGGASK